LKEDDEMREMQEIAEGPPPDYAKLLDVPVDDHTKN